MRLCPQPLLRTHSMVLVSATPSTSESESVVMESVSSLASSEAKRLQFFLSFLRLHSFSLDHLSSLLRYSVTSFDILQLYDLSSYNVRMLRQQLLLR